jgi:branched-chain amino acid transport system ATP-binding protein
MTPPPAARPLLDIRGISIAFGGLKAVQDFSLQIPHNDLYGLIGPNGAGKTTVFNLMTGVYRTQTGSIHLDGRRIDGLPPHRITAAGAARTFQNIRLFCELTVLDNVRVACHLRGSHSLFSTILRTPGHIAQERAITARAMELLKIFDLQDRASEHARNLPYGDQRRLEIARALATGPKLLLLDEPAAGMNPFEKSELCELIRMVRDRFKLTVLLIEHDMTVIMDLSSHITVLDHGITIAHGPPAEIRANPKVIEAYLGSSHELAPQERV